MKCECGFEFPKPKGTKCGSFLTLDGKVGSQCPVCGNAYVDGVKVELKKPEIDMD